jgi:N-acetylglutamate synthase-like GNAT family acetyltransferase
MDCRVAPLLAMTNEAVLASAQLACDPDPMQVRAATTADSDRVTKILAASYPALMRGAYSEALLERALPLITRANPALLESGTYYLAALDGEAVACGGWSHRPPERDSREPGLAHIRHFATHPDWTGRGAGRAVYDRCEADASAAGFTRFVCYASRNGERFYAALGFRRLREIAVPIAAGLLFPSVLMVREITPAS